MVFNPTSIPRLRNEPTFLFIEENPLVVGNGTCNKSLFLFELKTSTSRVTLLLKRLKSIPALYVSFSSQLKSVLPNCEGAAPLNPLYSPLKPNKDRAA